MSAFRRTRLALAADGFRRGGATLVVGGGLFLAWIGWSLLARVAVYEVSETARLEVDRAVHPVEPSGSGRVVVTALDLGRSVEAGEVLVELESDEERHRLAEARARKESLAAQVRAHDAAIAVLEAALEEFRAGLPAAVEEARAREAESDAQATLAEAEVERLVTLHEGGHLDLVRAIAAADRLGAAAEALGHEVARLALQAEQAPIALEEARARLREAEAAARHPAQELERLERIAKGGGGVAESEVEKTRTEAERLRAAADAIGHEVRRLEVAARQAPIALEEARSRLGEAKAQADLAEEEARRLARTGKDGPIVEADLLRARAEARQRRAAAHALQIAAARLEISQRVEIAERAADLEDRRRERARVEGDRASAAAAVERLEGEFERRRIRAPVAGRLGGVAELRVGSVVAAGESLGTIVPEGRLIVRAGFPASALGRVRTGQAARVRLAGFSWAEYGLLDAVVVRVAEEPVEGSLRVELDLASPDGYAVPLVHGMPGSVEVEVERTSPAWLLLRAVGRRLGGREDGGS